VIPRIPAMVLFSTASQSKISCQVRDFAEVARCGRMSRARVTQIMNLLLLAPDIQEDILFLAATAKGRDTITLRGVRNVLAEALFVKQRYMWGKIRQEAGQT